MPYVDVSTGSTSSQVFGTLTVKKVREIKIGIKIIMNILTSLPNDLFVQATLGEILIRHPYKAIQTFGRISLVCKSTNQKITSVWKLIIQQSPLITYLYGSSPISSEESKNFLQSNWKTLGKWNHLDFNKIKRMDLNKWKSGNPNQTESTIYELMEQCIPNQKNPTLYIVEQTRTQLTCIDLVNKICSLNIDQPLQLLNYTCYPSMASSDSWIAICCDRIEQNSIEIPIIDRITGNRLYCISSNPGSMVFKIECENNFLYVFCKNFQGRYQLLQYNSNDWELPPKTLLLPKLSDSSDQFYIGTSHFFFSRTQFALSKHYLLAIPKTECFSDENPYFFSKEIEQFHSIQVDGNDHYILSQNQNNVIVNKLSIISSTIFRISLCNLFLNNFYRIQCFYVHFDKIFITIIDKGFYRILCYNLINANLLKEFSVNAIPTYTVIFKPKFIVTSSKEIQFLFSSIQFDNGFQEVTKSVSLDYT